MANTFKLKTKANVGITTQNVYVVPSATTTVVIGITLANITGGGLADNIKRVIPSNLCAEIDLSKINPPKIFKWIKNKGVSDVEMLKTFNCGVGFCFVTKKINTNKVKKYFSKEFEPYIIGQFIKNNKKKILFNEKIKW